MTTISTDPVARTEILARIRPASTDITNSDPVSYTHLTLPTTPYV